MIPREILKKIRQIELRTNRIVNETLATDSFQPMAQFVGMPVTDAGFAGQLRKLAA